MDLEIPNEILLLCSLKEHVFCQQIIEVANNFRNIKCIEIVKRNYFGLSSGRKERSAVANENVLLFPPLNPRGRFLIHKCIESVDGISSVSIGSENCRRVVLYHLYSIEKSKEHTNTPKDYLLHRHHKSVMSSPSDIRSAIKRPDKGLYVPKHRRNFDDCLINKKNCENSESVATTNDEIKSHTTKSKNDQATEKVKALEKNSFDNTTKNHVGELEKNISADETCIFTRKYSVTKETKLPNDTQLKKLQFVLEMFSENLTRAICSEVFSTFQGRNNDILLPKVILSNEQLKIVLPGIATNFVNTAIENALELMKAIQSYEKRANKSASVLDTDTNSNDVIEEHIVSSAHYSVAKKKNRKKGSTKEFNEKQKFYMRCVQSESQANEACSVEAKMSTHSKRLVKVYHDKTVVEESAEGLKRAIDLTTKQLDKILVENTTNDDELMKTNGDSWDTNWTDDGECLNEEMKKELSSLTGIKNSSIRKPPEVIDYLDFKTKDIELDEGEFGHILELFDFSPILKTQDLFNALKTAGVSDYNITWVDDTHALAVFGSMGAAHNAMKQYTPILQMRQVINGTVQSKRKAREFKDALLPYKRRPVATAAVARNLITGALGIKSQVSSEQRNKERRLLKEAREQKRNKTKQKKDIWEDPQ